MIEVEGLTKSYGANLALDHIQFSIRKGEIVGFLGPNGAGKTTTMKILTGYLMPDEGTAQVAGLDVREHAVETKRRVGYLPESTPLYTEMWVEEYLGFMAQVREIPKKDRRAAITRVAEACGLKGVLRKSIGELSKGYRQRVGLAQAMIHDPEILILDEPTVGLDPNQIAEIRDLIRRLGQEKTVILSTHILSEVEATCGRALIISQGRIVADGQVSDLLGAKAGETIYLTWKAPLETAEAALQGLACVSSIAEKSQTNGRSRFALRSKGGDEACEEIFALAAAKGWKISQLHRESASLEQVFRQLTGEAKAPAEVKA